MSTKKTPPLEFNKLFEQAMEAFESAVDTGAKVQQEAARHYGEMLDEWGTLEKWQKNYQEAVKAFVPVAKKNVDDAVETMNENARTSIALLKKGMETFQSGSVQETQENTRILWESMLEAMRKNAQSMVQANSRILDSLNNLGSKTGKATTPSA